MLDSVQQEFVILAWKTERIKHLLKNIKTHIKSPEYLEGVRFGNVNARLRASELHKEVNQVLSAQDKPGAIPGRPVTIGTDCSGMEAPIQAFRNLKGVKHEHMFSCDCI